MRSQRCSSPTEREADQPVVALAKRLEQAPVARRQSGRRLPLEAGEQRPPPGRSPEKHECVGRDAHERRGEHRQQSLVVVAVLEQPKVGEEIDDLLLPEVPAPGRAVRRQPLRAQRVLVGLGARPGREQEHDVSGSAFPAVDECPYARRDVPRLAVPPRRPRLPVARLVGDQHLDGRPEEGVGEACRRPPAARSRRRTPLRRDGSRRRAPRAASGSSASARARRRCVRGAHETRRRRRGGTGRSTGTRRRRRRARRRRRRPAEIRSTSSHWSRFVSWNSSTMIERKRKRARSRTAACSRRRSRAMSWRSSKSTADSRSFASRYAVSKPGRRSCRSGRSRVATSSSAARSTAATASDKRRCRPRRELAGAPPAGQAAVRVGQRESAIELGERSRPPAPRSSFVASQAAQLRDACLEVALPAGRKVEREPGERRRSKTPMSIVCSPREP